MKAQATLPQQPPPEPSKHKERWPVVREYVEPIRPALRFSPTAWAKLLFFRDRGQSEIGGFGIAAADDLLRIEEFCTVKQLATYASIAFDDLAVADFFELQVDAGRKPEQFGRIWLHTHPGNSASPSGTDEETFARVFGHCQWAAMFVLARGGHCYARLRFNTGPGGESEIPVEVDYSRAFGPSNFDVWEDEYKANIQIDLGLSRFVRPSPILDEDPWADQMFSEAWVEELEMMEPVQRRLLLTELNRQFSQNKEGETCYERNQVEQPVC